MRFKYPLFKVDFDNNDKSNINDIIDSGWISPGLYTEKLENTFKESVVSGYSCMTTSSCTTALALSMHLIDIKKGDEVLVAGINFIAVVNTIINFGATPVFVDCKSSKDPNIEFKDLKNKFSKKTKALVVVHFAGYPIEDIHSIKNFCKKNNIFLIEDVAHAPMAQFDDGLYAGTVGDISCFSFFSNKNIPAGEGGMLCSKDESLIKRAKILKSHGMSIQTSDRYKKSALMYDVLEAGYNFRMPEISCGLALSQLEKYINHGLDKRRKLISIYRKSLNNVGLDLIYDCKNDKNAAPHIAICLLPENINKTKVQNMLSESGIQTSMHYPNFSSFKAVKNYINNDDLSNCNRYVSKCITLPFYESLSTDDINYITAKIGDILNKLH